MLCCGRAQTQCYTCPKHALLWACPDTVLHLPQPCFAVASPRHSVTLAPTMLCCERARHSVTLAPTMLCCERAQTQCYTCPNHALLWACPDTVLHLPQACFAVSVPRHSVTLALSMLCCGLAQTQCYTCRLNQSRS